VGGVGVGVVGRPPVVHGPGEGRQDPGSVHPLGPAARVDGQQHIRGVWTPNASSAACRRPVARSCRSAQAPSRRSGPGCSPTSSR
jgi:hypothetical protein